MRNVLYAQMAVSAWLAWKADGRRTSPVVPVYGAQLLLNLAWTTFAAFLDLAVHRRNPDAHTR